MTEILGLTKALLSRIMSVVKTDINAKDALIINAAMNGCGRTLIKENTALGTGKKYVYGDVVKRTQTYISTTGGQTTVDRYYYYNGSSLVQLTPSVVKSVVEAGTLFAFPLTIPSAYWSTATPFKDNCGYLKGVAKGETVHGHTRWLLQMEEDGEDQRFTAGNGKVADYYGSHQFVYGKPIGIWELWLPSTLAANSVVIDY